MIAFLFIVPLLLTPVDERAQTYYAHKNVPALQEMLAGADERAVQMLCRYRLYPLTEDAAYLRALPDELEDASARELALLAGLWGYRAAEAPFYKAISHGRRSLDLLEAARARDPNEPFLLLIEGQSLLFRPAIAGGSDEQALDRFRELRRAVAQRPETGISVTEAEVWTWYALRRIDAGAARAMRQRLLSEALPPLYREFLNARA